MILQQLKIQVLQISSKLMETSNLKSNKKFSMVFFTTWMFRLTVIYNTRMRMSYMNSTKFLAKELLAQFKKLYSSPLEKWLPSRFWNRRERQTVLSIYSGRKLNYLIALIIQISSKFSIWFCFQTSFILEWSWSIMEL